VCSSDLYADEDGICPGGFGSVTGSGSGIYAVSTSPEGVLVEASEGFADDPLSPGTDVSGSILLTVSLGITIGEFEIDTTCMDPGNHLAFDPSAAVPFVPGFTKATITIEPTCFADTVGYVVNEQPTGAAAADFDGDGDRDLAITSFGASVVDIRRNNGDGTFSSIPGPAGGAYPRGIAAGDLNGDGDIDLAFCKDSDGEVAVLIGNGNGTFVPAVDYPADVGLKFLVLGDLDADGDLDIAAVGNIMSELWVFLNDGDGTFPTSYSQSLGDGPYGLAMADFDLDSDLDLAVGHSTGLYLMENSGTASFILAADYLVGFGLRSVFAGDWNSDGSPDVAAASFSENNVSILLNDGAGDFTDAGDLSTGLVPVWVHGGDLTGDGDPDLIVANNDGNSVSVFMGDGDGTFTPGPDLPGGIGPLAIAAADYDADGSLDLACVTTNFDFDRSQHKAGPTPGRILINLNCSRDDIADVVDFGEGGARALRAALLFANSNPGDDTITFYSLNGEIAPLTPLPSLTDVVGGTFLAGLTATGSGGDYPALQIDGSLVSTGPGLQILSSNNRVEGLAFRNFDGAGIEVGVGHYNIITGCAFHGNTGLPIELRGELGVDENDGGDTDQGANDLVNFPIIDSIFLVQTNSFDISGTAPALATVELFQASKYLGADTLPHASEHGEAWRLLGTATANASGRFNLSSVDLPAWSHLTATATDTLGNTSEFALNRRAIPDSLIVTGYSPVVITVITPSMLDSIGRDVVTGGFNTIGPTAQYDSLTDYSDPLDGDPDDRVIITNIEPGEYTIRVTTKPGDDGTEYVLGIRVDGTNEVYAGVSGGLSSSPVENPVPPRTTWVSCPVWAATQSQYCLSSGR